MFAPSYFPARYFAPRYFPPAVAPEVDAVIGGLTVATVRSESKISIARVRTVSAKAAGVSSSAPAIGVGRARVVRT